MKLTLPTAITLFRIALIPVFVIVFYLPFSWVNIAAAIVYFIASISDWVDGYLARILKQESRFGAFLDPVADKLMVAVAIIILVEKNPSLFIVIPSVIIISREITISALREWLAEIGDSATMKVSYIGKVKTVAQMFSLGLMIYAEPLFGLPIYQIGMAFFYFAAIMTLVSMFFYLRAAWPVMRQNG